MKTWDIYMKLQTSFAYGDDVGAPSQWAGETDKLTSEYVQRVRAERELRGTLIIGPGGPEEIQSLKAVMPGPLYALTAHRPEVDRILPYVEDNCAVLGDIHELPFQTAVFDVLFASNVLEHCLAPYIALMQCRRVLREHALAIFVLPSFEGREGGRGPFHLHCLDRPVWLELLRKTGFAVADAYVQQGEADIAAHYTHYRCVAVPVPAPHDRVMNDLVTYHAGRQ